MLALLSLLLAAPPQFEVKAPSPEERERRAKIRCGGPADPVNETTFTCHDQPGVDVTTRLRRAAALGVPAHGLLQREGRREVRPGGRRLRGLLGHEAVDV